MDYDREIHQLAAETAAMQMITTHIYRALIERDPGLKPVLEAAFDSAISELEDFTIRWGVEASPDHLLKAVKIADQQRRAVFRGDDGP
ncbi:MAG: hypothetical protein ACU0B1_16620, partial [Thermohalobaculum sp.]